MSETMKRAAIGLLIVLCVIVLFFGWAVYEYGWEEITWIWDG